LHKVPLGQQSYRFVNEIGVRLRLSEGCGAALVALAFEPQSGGVRIRRKDPAGTKRPVGDDCMEVWMGSRVESKTSGFCN
jgi:hypothetical protein